MLPTEYYSRKYIGYLIYQNALNRDFSLITPDRTKMSRGHKIVNTVRFNRILEITGIDKNKFNLYRSLAKLRNIPDFTWNFKERSEETKGWYSNQYVNEIYEYDLFLDFDKEEEDSWEELLNEVINFTKKFDKFKVPYYVLFSGRRGFQVIIDGKYIPIKDTTLKSIFPHKTIVEKIEKYFGLKFLDTSGNGVYSKLCKIPYSLVGDNVVLPLTPEQLYNFKIEDMNINEVMKLPLMNRGVIQRKGDSNTTQTFIKSLDIFTL